MKSRIFFWIIACAVPVSVFASTENFSRNLSIGMRGSDVLALQQFLNKDVDTRIADTGAGSVGNETDYFGQATKRAVIKFQEKYRVAVLSPAGLVSGSGFFGAKTREHLLFLRKTNAEVEGSSTKTTLPSESVGSVVVMFPSQYSGKAGTMIRIMGAGFTKNNTIYFGSQYLVTNAVSANGQEIAFAVPNIPKGNYALYVKNEKGESNKDAFFVVVDGVTPEPMIENITNQGGVVTVSGSGFTKKENTVRTGMNIFEEVLSADGKSLSFTIPAMKNLSTTTSSLAKKTSFPIWVYVVNENGVSNGKSFNLDL